MKRLYTSVLIIGLFFTSFFSCKKEKTVVSDSCSNEQTSYALDIAPIIASNCMGGSCHNNTSIGDYSSYTGVKSKVDSGSFERMVIDLKVMPPTSRPPLSSEDLNSINCWLEAGAPNN